MMPSSKRNFTSSHLRPFTLLIRSYSIDVWMCGAQCSPLAFYSLLFFIFLTRMQFIQSECCCRCCYCYYYFCSARTLNWCQLPVSHPLSFDSHEEMRGFKAYRQSRWIWFHCFFCCFSSSFLDSFKTVQRTSAKCRVANRIFQIHKGHTVHNGFSVLCVDGNTFFNGIT